MFSYALARNGEGSRLCRHARLGTVASDYMSDNYLPHGEKSTRLSWSATAYRFAFITACGLLGRGDLLTYVTRALAISLPNAAHVRALLERSSVARVLVLLLPAMLSSITYYARCSAIEAKYDARPRREASEWKIQANRFLDSRKHSEEVVLGCLNAAVAATLGNCLLLAHLLYGYTRLYTATEEYGLLWFGASFVVLFLHIEFWAYVSHRFWHHAWFYRYFHKVHHRYQPPTAFAAVAIHPVEFAIYVIGGQSIFWLVPIHLMVAAVVGLYTTYHLIEDHSGVKRTPIWPWQPTSKYHDDHHRYFHCNFGQHILLFDQLFGTLYDPSREYGESIFGGKGKLEPRDT